ARATALGMAALVELHDDDDFARARTVSPPLVGINARDLSTFRVDLLTPLRLRPRIDWPHRAVFESGAFNEEDAMLARSGGFEGLLVGEAAVRNPDAITDLSRGLAFPAAASAFWTRIAELGGARRPIVKICGITNRDDAVAAVDAGADLLGFVFADSPRRATPELLSDVAGLDALKVAVVVAGGPHGPLDRRVRDLLDSGLIDAIQFHGDEAPDECARWGFPYYKAVRVATADDLERIGDYRGPRVLIDARADGAYGGSGVRVPVELLRAALDASVAGEAGYAGGRPLWIAGGLTDANVADVVRAFAPELVDASSGLEREPGRKDHARVRRFIDAARAAGRDRGERA
ncbi:MAG: bifunctional indole-3-glycerol phosphate synthase/phosphoribosylanthranilate isomerase, partial [Spirochaetaceae bacterium]